MAYDFGFGLSMLTMEGTFEDKNGNSFEFEAKGVITDNSKKKSQIDLNIKLTTAERIISVDDFIGEDGLEFLLTETYITKLSFFFPQ